MFTNNFSNYEIGINWKLNSCPIIWQEPILTVFYVRDLGKPVLRSNTALTLHKYDNLLPYLKFGFITNIFFMGPNPLT